MQFESQAKSSRIKTRYHEQPRILSLCNQLQQAFRYHAQTQLKFAASISTSKILCTYLSDNGSSLQLPLQNYQSFVVVLKVGAFGSATATPQFRIATLFCLAIGHTVVARNVVDARTSRIAVVIVRLAEVFVSR